VEFTLENTNLQDVKLSSKIKKAIIPQIDNTLFYSLKISYHVSSLVTHELEMFFDSYVPKEINRPREFNGNKLFLYDTLRFIMESVSNKLEDKATFISIELQGEFMNFNNMIKLELLEKEPEYVNRGRGKFLITERIITPSEKPIDNLNILNIKDETNRVEIGKRVSYVERKEGNKEKNIIIVSNEPSEKALNNFVKTLLEIFHEQDREEIRNRLESSEYQKLHGKIGEQNVIN
jgi:hypothetical protein